MEPETAASGGWQAAIDPALAARLLRPAVRPGVSDPHHGRTLAARLQRMAAPTLSDDVARRYGSTALDAGGPPVVYAAPPIQAASMDSRRTVADPSGTLRKGLDAGRPVVQATARTTGPVFPPLRPPGAGPVQRMSDPAAVRRVSDAAPPVQRMTDPGVAIQPMSDSTAVQRTSDSAPMPSALARRIERGTASGASTGSRAAERSVPGRLVVAPAPTRLQRQIAVEHAESVPIAAPPRSRAHAMRPVGGGGGGGTAPPVVARAGAGSASPGPATATAAIVQRRIDPAAAHPPPVAGEGEPEGTQAAAPLVVLVAPGGGGGAGAAASAGPAALPVAMPAGTGGGGRTGGGAIQAIRAQPAERWSPRSATGGGGGGEPSGTRPVVAARSGGGRGGTAVQRMAMAMAAGAGSALGGPATRMVHAAPAVVVQREAAIEPPAGAPSATLPTMTAGDAPGAGGAGGSSAAELSEQVYGLLVRRLESERKQRGW